MTCRSLGLSILFALAAGLGTSLPAADLRNVLTDYAITSWSSRDGLPPGNIWALAQDADGYLWVGSDGGLHRFDGTRFLQWALDDSRPVRSLYAARNGTLWVGFGDRGGIDRIRGGRATRFAEPQGLASGAVMVIAEDRHGTLWAGGDAGLFQLANERWDKWPEGRGLPNGVVYSAFADRHDGLYVGTEIGIFRRKAGADRFEELEGFAGAGVPRPERTDTLGSRRSFTEAASGRVLATVGQFPRSFVENWSGQVVVNDWNLGYRAVAQPPASGASLEEGRGYRLLMDSQQNLWVGTIGQGLWRVQAKAKGHLRIERATALTGLLSDGIGTLLEDRDGNIWAGTTEGLNRLTPRRINQLTNFGLVVGIDITRDGTVWAGALDELIRFPDGNEALAETVPLQARFRIMHADQMGTLWVATDRYLARLPPGARSPQPLPARQSLRGIDLLASDGTGRLWSYASNEGLAYWKDGVLHRVTLPSEVRHTGMSVLYGDRQDRLWAGLMDGRVLVRDADGTLRVFGSGDGLTSGISRQVFQDDDGTIWLAATAGLSKFIGDRFVTVRSDHGLPANDLTAIAEDDDGHLWIGSGFGILQIVKDEFDSVAEGRARAFRYTSYGRADGLAGMPHAYDNNRRVVRDGQGRLWYVTSRGVSLLDPRVFHSTQDVRPITIEQVSADGRILPATDGLRLPARTSRVEVVYSQLNLSTQSRSRFRHMLEGFDSEWVEAGTRRQAFYTNLPPGDFVFRVATSRADGTWADSDTSLAFAIEPTFYETTWFYSGCAIAVVVSVAGVWRLRLRQMRRQFSLVLRERVRLSREIHDTLLQSLVGIALQFDAVAADVEPSSGTQRQLVRMRKQVEEYIREARQAIWDLRVPDGADRGFTEVLRNLGEHATRGTPTRFAFDVFGKPSDCPPKVREQLVRIGREAVGNALRHGRPTLLRIALQFEERAVILQVSDDGCGFDASQAPEPDAVHYGLITMRERAEEVGGSLEVSSRANQGTNVRAIVPLRARASLT